MYIRSTENGNDGLNRIVQEQLSGFRNPEHRRKVPDFGNLTAFCLHMMPENGIMEDEKEYPGARLRTGSN